MLQASASSSTSSQALTHQHVLRAFASSTNLHHRLTTQLCTASLQTFHSHRVASAVRGGFGNQFGVLLNEGAFTGLLARAVVVADEKGNVLHTELVSDIANEPNYDAAINSLK
jgi:peroxiredoxin